MRSTRVTGSAEDFFAAVLIKTLQGLFSGSGVPGSTGK